MASRVAAVKHRERRKDWRRPVSIKCMIGPWTATLTDISSNGVGGALDVTAADEARLVPGQLVEAVIPIDDLEGLAFTLEIKTGLGADLSFGARFVGVTDAQFRLIEGYVTGRSRERCR